jgi:Mn2+/Fe2+ NRAMP family transporter
VIVFALVGATVAPWQLFFQQSNVVDKRITARWLGYERLDTLVGLAVFCVGAIVVLITFASAFEGTPWHGSLAGAGQLTAGLSERLGALAGGVFALVLLNASLLGACVVTLSRPRMRWATCSDTGTRSTAAGETRRCSTGASEPSSLPPPWRSSLRACPKGLSRRRCRR